MQNPKKLDTVICPSYFSNQHYVKFQSIYYPLDCAKTFLLILCLMNECFNVILNYVESSCPLICG